MRSFTVAAGSGTPLQWGFVRRGGGRVVSGTVENATAEPVENVVVTGQFQDGAGSLCAREYARIEHIAPGEVRAFEFEVPTEECTLRPPEVAVGGRYPFRWQLETADGGRTVAGTVENTTREPVEGVEVTAHFRRRDGAFGGMGHDLVDRIAPGSGASFAVACPDVDTLGVRSVRRLRRTSFVLLDPPALVTEWDRAVASCRLRNVSEWTYFYAEVQFDFYDDEGTLLGSVLGYVEDVEPGDVRVVRGVYRGADAQRVTRVGYDDRRAWKRYDR